MEIIKKVALVLLITLSMASCIVVTRPAHHYHGGRGYGHHHHYHRGHGW